MLGSMAGGGGGGLVEVLFGFFQKGAWEQVYCGNAETLFTRENRKICN